MHDTAVLAIIAGVGLALAFGFLLLGGTRAHERYSEGKLVRATAYGTLAALALAATGAGIVLGLISMARK